MASVTRKTGASGLQSPYWQAKFKGLEGRIVWLSTKLTNQKKALAVAQRWEHAAQLATKWELTQERSAQILSQVSEIAKNPATIDSTKMLLGELLVHSIGETFKGQNLVPHQPPGGSVIVVLRAKERFRRDTIQFRLRHDNGRWLDLSFQGGLCRVLNSV